MHFNPRYLVENSLSVLDEQIFAHCDVGNGEYFALVLLSHVLIMLGPKRFDQLFGSHQRHLATKLAKPHTFRLQNHNFAAILFCLPLRLHGGLLQLGIVSLLLQELLLELGSFTSHESLE